MRVLILGADGMLGHKMAETLLPVYPNSGMTVRGPANDLFYRQRASIFSLGQLFGHVDATKEESLYGLVSELRPQVMVNCIGMIKQRNEVNDAVTTITLNALLPHRLAAWASHWGGRVIHFSTDCVFNGKRGQYREDDPSDADDLYGRSKFLGEIQGDHALTLRTSIIGRELSHFRSLLEWFLAQRGKSVRGFSKVIYSGVTTNYLASLVCKIIKDHETLSGLYQVTSTPISKYDLLHLINHAFDLNIHLIKDDTEVSDRSMIGERFVAATGYQTPRWPVLIDALAKDATPYHSFSRALS